MRKFSVIACILALSLVCPAASALELVYSDHEPLGNMRTAFLNNVFFKAVYEQSGGTVRINPRWNGEISISYDALKTIKEGSRAQIAVIVPEYSANELPLHQIFKSFPAGPTGQEQLEFFKGVYREVPELLQELDAQGLHIIFISTGYPAAFFSAKPLAGLQAVKGQKWRSASFRHKDFLSSAGAVAVTMAWGQGVFDALNDGTLDGLIMNIDSGYDIKAHKAAPNILVSPKLWLGHEYIIAMNKDAWDNLADEEKAAIDRAAEVSYSKLGEVMNAAFINQLEVLKADGADVRLLSDEEVSFWEQASNYTAAQDKWVEEQSSKGLASAGDVLARIQRYMSYFLQEK